MVASRIKLIPLASAHPEALTIMYTTATSTCTTIATPAVRDVALDLQAKIETTLMACLAFLRDEGMALVQTEKSAEVVFEDEVEERPTINDCATLFGNPSCAAVLIAVCLDHIADDILHEV
uniref:Uncharacterized protein n=1 Tax=Marseillevirus LCMAC202 TaxID=2506606 RepID=A0A481YZP4_9VIRU|nr:MAG: hypothetical protein LCMAC202_03550 [Marseillevirus LCMAC202]